MKTKLLLLILLTFGSVQANIKKRLPPDQRSFVTGCVVGVVNSNPKFKYRPYTQPEIANIESVCGRLYLALYYNKSL